MNRFDRFCYKYNRYSIKNLMLYITAGNLAVFLLSFLFVETGSITSLLSFDADAILRGEVWRLLTFIFIPPSSSPLFILLVLYVYYLIGNSLEQEWGSLKFNIYYLTGMLGTMAIGFIFRFSVTTEYLNLSLFLALATLFPNYTFMLFFVIPVKAKYLAFLNALFLLATVVFSSFPYNLLPIVAVANYILYFFGAYIRILKNRKNHYRRSREFRSTVRETTARVDYFNKCVICGRTDTEYPELEFRYCDQCNGHYCYCMEHLHNHEHKK